MKGRFFWAGLLLSLCSNANPADLIEDQGAQLVRAHCSSCHSLQLVTSNRGDRQMWLETIRWMQASQNLWPIDAVSEEQILTYLAKNYPAATAYRRLPLPQDLMP